MTWRHEFSLPGVPERVAEARRPPASILLRAGLPAETVEDAAVAA